MNIQEATPGKKSFNPAAMEKRLFIIGIIAMVVAVSCAKEEKTEPKSPEQASFKAVAEATKTALGTGNAVEWLSGDQINLFAGGTSYTYTAQHGGAEAVFTGDAVSAAEYYALYPYSAKATISGSTITTVLPAEQSPSIGSFADDTGIMMAYSTDDQLSFKHVCGYLQITVTSEGITSVTVRSNNGTPLSGKIEIDWNSGNPSVNVLNPCDHVNLVSASGTIAPGVYYLAVLPFSSSTGLSIRFNKTSLQTAAVKASDAAAATRAEILNLKTPETGITSWRSRTDLSASGTANSYVVSDAGVYRFKDATGNASATKSGAAIADWLWADANGLVYDITRENDGYIAFTAGSTKGNTIIAGRRTSDDRIMWTWHIWLTDDPTETICYEKDTDHILMDRNLGATTATPDVLTSYGLYYEWGRKDPFPASSVLSHNGYAESGGPVNATTYVRNTRYSDVFKSVDNSTYTTRGNEIALLRRQPMTYVAYKAGSYSWFVLPEETATTPSSVWTSEGVELWGVSLDGKTVVKSLYDPCPPGWKVPTNLNDSMSGLTGAATTYGFTYNGASGTSVHFPAAGSRACGKSGRLANPGLDLFYWSAQARAKAGNGDQGWSFRKTSPPGAMSQASIQPTNGCSVRCEKFVE